MKRTKPMPKSAQSTPKEPAPKPPAKPTATQQDVLDKLAASQSRRLISLKGGFWTLPELVTAHERETGYLTGPSPSWYVGTLTVRAMEARRYITRADVHKEAWRDERVLTAEGAALAISTAETRIRSRLGGEPLVTEDNSDLGPLLPAVLRSLRTDD